MVYQTSSHIQTYNKNLVFLEADSSYNLRSVEPFDNSIKLVDFSSCNGRMFFLTEKFGVSLENPLEVIIMRLSTNVPRLTINYSKNFPPLEKPRKVRLYY